MHKAALENWNCHGRHVRQESKATQLHVAVIDD